VGDTSKMSSSCCASGGYLRYSLSYRDQEEMMAERGLSVDHVTIWRWDQRYAPLLNQRLSPRASASESFLACR
jgi:transposase-like protein